MYFSKSCGFKYKNRISPKKLISHNLLGKVHLRKKPLILCQVQYKIGLRKRLYRGRDIGLEKAL